MLRCKSCFFSFLQSTVGKNYYFFFPFAFLCLLGFFFKKKVGGSTGKKSITSYFLAIPLLAMQNNACAPSGRNAF